MSLEDYIAFNKSKADEFEPVEGTTAGFPCCACKHLERPENECSGCRYY